MKRTFDLLYRASCLLLAAGVLFTACTEKPIDNEKTDISIRDAKDVCDTLGISHHVIDLRDEFKKCGLDRKVWQYFTIVPDFKSVGVKENARSFEWPVIIRAVNTVDAMTATIEEIDYVVLHKITNRILSEVKGVNRVLYDLTPKPCGTIEWE